MRKLVLATVLAVAAIAAATAAVAQVPPVPLGPGSVITGSFPQPGGGTIFVVLRADGSHAVADVGPRGGLRRYIVIDNPPVQRGGYSYELNGRTIVVPPSAARGPINQVYLGPRRRLHDPHLGSATGGRGNGGGSGDR